MLKKACDRGSNPRRAITIFLLYFLVAILFLKYPKKKSFAGNMPDMAFFCKNKENKAKIMEKEKLKELRKKANAIKPIVRIGKDGLKQSLIEEINVHLKKRKLIKIKALRSAAAEDEKGFAKKLAKSISEETKSEIIDIIGLNIVLYRQSAKST